MTTYKLLPLLPGLQILLTFLLVGCIGEGSMECFDKRYPIIVRAYDTEGVALSGSEVTGVVLYVFDGQEQFLHSIPVRLDETVWLDKMGEDLCVVAWGNLNGRNRIHLSSTVSDSYMELMQNETPGSGEQIPMSDDLFLGSLLIKKSEQPAEKELPIYRKMGSLAITVRNLDKVTGSYNDDYSFYVSDTYSRIGFDSRLSGNRVTYIPSFTGNAKEYKMEPFLMVPEEHGVSVEITCNGSWFTTVSQKNDGSPITIYPGLLTNLLIEFRGVEMNVSTTLSPWGQVENWKEF